MLEKATSIYLFLPLVLFFIGWLSPQIAILLIAITLIAIIKIPKTTPLPKSPSLFFIALAGAFLSGAYPLFPQSGDWIKHNAMLRDLTLLPWPNAYPILENSDIHQVPLVYSFGYYLPASVVGKIFGIEAASAALFVWTLFGLYFVVSWLKRFTNDSIFLSSLFFLLGGMDLLGWLIMNNVMPDPVQHIERWIHFKKWQYSGNFTLLNWVPQHAIPAWLGASLILNEKESRTNPLPILGAIVIWSPFAALSFLTLSIFTFIRSKPSFGAFVRTAATTIFLSLPPALFLTSAVSSNAPPLLLSEAAFNPSKLFLFLTLEVYLFSIPLLSRSRDPLLFASMIFLTAIPFIAFGYNNDFCMRVSIVYLFILWVSVLSVLESHKGAIRIYLALAVGLGILGSLHEIRRRILLRNKVVVPGITSSNLKSVPHIPEGWQYLGDGKSAFFAIFGKKFTVPLHPSQALVRPERGFSSMDLDDFE